jgi:hypothetical protein
MSNTSINNCRQLGHLTVITLKIPKARLASFPQKKKFPPHRTVLDSDRPANYSKRLSNTHTQSPQKVRVVPESDKDRSCYPHLFFAIIPPVPTWTHMRIHLPTCAYSIPAFMHMEPRKTKNVGAWHGTVLSTYYICYMCLYPVFV